MHVDPPPPSSPSQWQPYHSSEWYTSSHSSSWNGYEAIEKSEPPFDPMADHETERFPYPVRPRFRSRRSSLEVSPSGFPFGSLLVSSVILSALAALGWQSWRFISPMLEPPPAPTFAEAEPPAPVIPPVATAQNSQASPDQIELPALPSDGATPDPNVDLGNPGSRGRVIEPIGLAIRSQPHLDGAYLGGIVMGESVTVLEVSPDGNWQRVRRDLNGQEGWVKAGNLGPTDVAVAPPPQAPAAPEPAAPVQAAAPDPEPAAASAPISASSGSRGRVLVPIGLALRGSPSADGAYVGGIPVNEVINVLEVSPDGNWQRIRRENGQEGWVKAGNLGVE